MSPQQILLMRHAEKPDDPTDPGLSEQGIARAKQLADYIPNNFGQPDFIFAAALSKHSARSYETVKPLSLKIGITIDATNADQDYSALASKLLSDSRYSQKRIVICWHHGNIPFLAHALMAKAGDYPDPWNPAVFNLMLHFEYASEIAPTVVSVTEPF